jgi:deazaflavin-dependent oxidoreductase (nitroreductase family)
MSGKFTAALRDTNQIDLAVTGRVTGRQITNPVWFVLENGTVHLLPVHGSDSDWFKNVLAQPEVRLTAESEGITARTVPVTDAGNVQSVVDKFQAKYGAAQIAKYYPKTDVAVDVKLPSSA